jgi:hypothetical protein
MSSPVDIERVIERAQRRLASAPPSGRKRRSDLGKFRIDDQVVEKLRFLLGGQEFPGIQSILLDLKQYCEGEGLSCPSRATIYKFMLKDPGRSYPMAELPAAVHEALYNQSVEAWIPGAQLAFYCFNYGGLPAIHFASSMPWLPLYQAYRMRGWRPMSRGLLRAVLLARRISRV